MFNEELKERVKELEVVVGEGERCGFQRGPTLCQRVDTLERFMYRMKDWCRHVEERLGVTEVMNNRQEYVFLGTKQPPLKGYYNEDGANGESTPDE